MREKKKIESQAVSVERKMYVTTTPQGRSMEGKKKSGKPKKKNLRVNPEIDGVPKIQLLLIQVATNPYITETLNSFHTKGDLTLIQKDS